jgi:hypothetical protein
MKININKDQITSDRIKVWRQTYGANQRPSGARFRDEITVCTRCHHVVVSSADPGKHCHQTDASQLVRRVDVLDPEILRHHGHRLSDRYLQKLVPAPCRGLRISPVVEAGYFWL